MKPIRTELEQYIIHWAGERVDLQEGLRNVAHQLDRCILLDGGVHITDPHIQKLFSAMLREAAKRISDAHNN